MKRRRRALLAVDYVPMYMFLQPRSFEGASGARTKAERGAAPAHPCLASTAPRAARDSPRGTMTLTRFVRYRDDSHAQRQCWKRAVSGSAAPETVNRRAERRWAQRPFAKGARTPAKACTLQVAPIGAPPLGFARGQGPPCQGGNTTATAAPTKGSGGFRMAV